MGRPEWCSRVNNVNKSFGAPPPLPKTKKATKSVVDCQKPASMDAPIRKMSLQRVKKRRGPRKASPEVDDVLDLDQQRYDNDRRLARLSSEPRRTIAWESMQSLYLGDVPPTAVVKSPNLRSTNSSRVSYKTFESSLRTTIDIDEASPKQPRVFFTDPVRPPSSNSDDPRLPTFAPDPRSFSNSSRGSSFDAYDDDVFHDDDDDDLLNLNDHHQSRDLLFPNGAK